MYLPLLSVSQLNRLPAEEAAPRPQEGDRSLETPGTLLMRDELLNSTHKYLGHINSTLQQLDGGSVVGRTTAVTGTDPPLALVLPFGTRH